MEQSSKSSISDPRSAGRVIRDPVYDYVVMPVALNELVDHRFVQRLRRIAQTPSSSSVYPAMTGTRFEHVLGAMHLARDAWGQAWLNTADAIKRSFQNAVWRDLKRTGQKLDAETARWCSSRSTFDSEFDNRISISVGTAALLHDIGHTPFSHTLEAFYARNVALVTTGVHGVGDASWSEFQNRHPGVGFHELVGWKMLDQIDSACVSTVPWWVVKAIIHEYRQDTWSGCLHELVAGEVDIDRLDYLLRDARLSGTEFGAIDRTRLIQSLELHDTSDGDGSARERGVKSTWRIGYGYRARTALETFLINRMRYYQWVIYHPHSVAASQFLDLALEDLLGLASMNPTTDIDRTVKETLDGIRPTLNYFIPKPRSWAVRKPTDDAGHLVSELFDTSSVALQAEVDDSTVLEWMKSSASFARAIQSAAGLSAETSRRLDRYLALYDAVLFRVPNWAPVWKTEDQYGSIAAELEDELRKALETLSSQILRETTEALTGRQPTEHLMLQSAALNQISAEMDRSSAAGLNSLARHMLHRGQPDQRFEREQLLARRLTELTSMEPPLRNGFWVLAYKEILPANDDTSAVRVFNGNYDSPLRKLSSIVSVLPAVAESNPKLYAFYVVPSNSRMRENRQSPYAENLAHEFVEKFPQAVLGCLRALLAMPAGH